MDRAALTDAARAGDAQALGRLLILCRPDLTRYARRTCQSDDVEEAVQDALWLLHRHAAALRTPAALSAWLFQVVRRLCLRLMRTRATRDRLFGAGLTEDLAAAPPDTGLRLDLIAALERMPRAYRDVLILRDLGGLDAAETAAELGISANAVKSRLHRARAAMRAALAPASVGAPTTIEARP